MRYCILLAFLTGCASTPCFDVNISGRLPTDGWGNARGEICLPPPPDEEKKE